MRSGQGIAEAEGKQRISHAAIRNELPVICVQRACPPSPRGMLVVQQPGKTTLNARVAGLNTSLSQSDDRETRHVPVAGRIHKLRFRSQLLRPIAAAPLELPLSSIQDSKDTPDSQGCCPTLAPQPLLSCPHRWMTQVSNSPKLGQHPELTGLDFAVHPQLVLCGFGCL